MGCASVDIDVGPLSGSRQPERPPVALSVLLHIYMKNNNKVTVFRCLSRFGMGFALRGLCGGIAPQKVLNRSNRSTL